ncbi:hypothetical protein [Haloplanus halophilus]|uniref:hypothetical protein n=1 Tax=Haloplanus halophilus TaxID=2949993 RepID=UPI0020414634|nr:hypothetical protein [Haloplanus sp. GDY1]
MTATRARVGWALLFGLPMGAGIALATARTAGTGVADPLVVAAGGTAAALVTAFVFGATREGERSRPRG